MIDEPIFPRKALAKDIVDELLGVKTTNRPDSTHLVSNPSSGTFLSAQRRTGKSTFFQLDFIPELESRDIPVIYTDLWSDMNRDPADLINESVSASLRKLDGFISKTVRKLGLKKVSVAGQLSFDVGQTASSVTLANALKEFVTKHPAQRLVMVIDEAQHALASDAGKTAMFAMKAARDALNIGHEGKPRLLLVCTGSSRSKLGELVADKSTPFFGARVLDFPLLGKDFAAFMADHWNARFAWTPSLDSETVMQAFESIGYRPEALRHVVKDAIESVRKGQDINDVVRAVAAQKQSRLFVDLDSQFQRLPPLQQALFLMVLEEKESFVPFSKETIAECQKDVGEECNASAIQNAIDSLIKDELVWKRRRGDYHVDDLTWDDWLAQRKSMPAPKHRGRKKADPK